jgi:hypothetical protein
VGIFDDALESIEIETLVRSVMTQAVKNRISLRESVGEYIDPEPRSQRHGLKHGVHGAAIRSHSGIFT